MANTRTTGGTSAAMGSGSDTPMIDPDLEYAMDCEINATVISRTDALRSQLIQLTATRGRWARTPEEYNETRLRLMNELNAEMDRPDGKNTYISQAMLFNHSSQRSGRPAIAAYESRLYRLSAQELRHRFRHKLRPNPSGDTTDDGVVEVVFKKPPPDDSCADTSAGGKRRDNSAAAIAPKTHSKTDPQPYVPFNRSQSVPNAKVFGTLGSFANGFDTTVGQKATHSSGSVATIGSHVTANPRLLMGSPPRVSGIFRKNSPKNSHKSGAHSSSSSAVTEVTEAPAKRPLFMSGFEKKVVEAVRKGSMDVSNARNALRQQKNTYKNPMKSSESDDNEKEMDPNLRNIDPSLIEVIENEIITELEPMDWSDVAGLEFAKNKIKEIAVLPLLRPDLFRGIRKPPKGILLFGPPGTGKTFLGRCIASQTKSTFFSITVSALNSKWIGEGEKTIRAMFAVARARQPSVIFIDEIDSLLKNRSDSEHESSRRMKTEFLAQFEGIGTQSDEKLLIIGATNRPQELDDAARRRLSARLYIGLPEASARKQIIEKCLNGVNHSLTDSQIQSLADQTDGYSCADMKDLCRESALEPMRDSMIMDNIDDITAQEIRDITYEDFVKNLSYVKPTVRKEDLVMFEKWNHEFGTNFRQN
ncbi:unnamed protein product [Medioppia subpectinata]|uniref:AAA+ ATPase domain-containing protein n=1 Tax=Medioppia subpectinata TaxID=1979941 RepID=A0A7R9Q2H8_9ACAR|nr:unnamed protein product [Medioppia subpectinata]CAG2110291.1 unnamed protein product [Medioppia subpectinata]